MNFACNICSEPDIHGSTFGDLDDLRRLRVGVRTADEAESEDQSYQTIDFSHVTPYHEETAVVSEKACAARNNATLLLLKAAETTQSRSPSMITVRPG